MVMPIIKRYTISKDGIIAIDFTRGEIAEILRTGQRVNEGSTPMFSVKLRKRTGKTKIVSSEECTFVAFEKNAAVYASEFFDAKVTLKQENNALLWRIDVQNKTQDLLEWVELMSFTVAGKLKDEPAGQGEIVYPYNEGCKITNMAYRESMPFRFAEPDYPSKNSYGIFPNMIFAQFIAYVSENGGVYLGMHDEERTTKNIDFCYHNGKIKLFMRAFCDVDYGENYSMPFDSVMQIFDGDWHGAGDIYYAWFSKHLPNSLKKISENAALPSWYEESPLVVAYPLLGRHDTDMSNNGLYPYKNAFPFLDELSKATESKVMALLMHWEGTAPWAPPYVWPPYGGEYEFGAFVNEAHEKNMLVGLYCSGMGWTQQSNINLEYHCEEKFESLGIKNYLCANSDGEIASTICTAQRKGYDFCPSSDGAKKIFKDEFEKLCQSGIDYVQALDQNHGGGSYFCYSDKHGHTPAPGKWQQMETNKLLASIERKNVLFGCESAAAEPFLAQLPFSDNRFELNYYLGTPIPVYSYLYHEYVNNFMGNQICAMLEKTANNFTFRLAYSFTAGDMLTVVLSGDGNLKYAWCDYVEPKDKNVPKNTALPFIKELNAWRRVGGKSFLHFGKMIPPVEVDCTQEKFLLEDQKTYLYADSVLSAAYEYNGEKVQFLVNYNEKPVSVKFDQKYDVYLSSDLKKLHDMVDCITVAPLSVVMMKL